jgi:hypothetical protein
MRAFEAWLLQADSDVAAATRVFVQEDHSTYCQSIAKCQQTVEKSVKGLVEVMGEAGLVTNAWQMVGWKHPVERLVSFLVGRTPDQGVYVNIRMLFDNNTQSGIRLLDSFVPRKPPDGQPPFARNTEYPFDGLQENFRAPAEHNAFDLVETKRCQDVAKTVHVGCRKIASFVRRTYAI